MRLPVLLILAQATALCDGGAILFRQEAGPLAATVFASPSPLAVGTSDISVLLQNRTGLAPILNADVSLSLHGGTSNSDIRVHPTHELAQNKLLYAAPVTLMDTGPWQIAVAILQNGEWTHVTGTIEVTPAGRLVTSYWGYIAFPLVVIVGFIARERLILRKGMRLSVARLS